MLEVKNLRISFTGNDVIKGINFSISAGEILGIVGESGSGKSVTSLCIMGLLPPNASIAEGNVFYTSNDGNQIDFTKISEEEHRKLRGNTIAMIFQEPQTCLNPSMRCGGQLLESVLLHTKLKGKAAKEKCISLLQEMKLPDPHKTYKSYPHQLSGGQKQRLMIAIALAGNPKLLIADEPTTALDVTVQKSILTLLKDIRNRYNMGIIFISHDLSVVEDVADNVLVMQNGTIVEQGSATEVFSNPKHRYTQTLIDYRKRLNLPNDQNDSEKVHKKIFEVMNLEIQYGVVNKLFKRFSTRFVAVKNVSFNLYEGETLGLVGESGSGKSTIGRTLIKLIKKKSGDIFYMGQPLDNLSSIKLSDFRQNVQLIFQDPYSSLNPRITVGQALIEPILYHGLATTRNDAKAQVLELLQKVKLPENSYYRYPHEFSGGQRQRIVIARALTLKPKILICDEIISALDVAIQSQILDLLEELKHEFNLTYLFISHDLGVVQHISDRVVVLRHGQIEEIGPAKEIFNRPQSIYTKNLIDSVPGLNHFSN